MKLFFTFFTLILLQVPGFSQQDQEPTEQSHFSILIEDISLESGASSDLMLDLESKGVYTFKMAESLVIPSGCNVLVKDILTGNAFILNSNEPHSFSVNRAMTKRFRIQITEASVLVSK